MRIVSIENVIQDLFFDPFGLKRSKKRLRSEQLQEVVTGCLSGSLTPALSTSTITLPGDKIYLTPGCRGNAMTRVIVRPRMRGITITHPVPLRLP